MVDTRRAVAIGVVVLLVAGGLWWFFSGSSPEALIEERLKTLCELVGKESGESGIQTAMKAQSLRALFANPVEIRGDVSHIGGRHSPTELAGMIARARAGASTLKLSYADLTVEVQSPEEAALSFTARLRSGGGGRAGLGAGDTYRQVAARAKVVEGEWVFSQFKVVTVMKRP